VRITVSVIVSWFFALWWLVGGIRDFGLIRYNAAGSTRYRKVFPLFLCLLASFDLALLGYFLSVGKSKLILTTLIVFAFLWIIWSIVALRSWNKIARIP
jgi:hypothetical protein